MSSTTSTTTDARISALETGIKQVRKDLTSLASTNERILAFLEGTSAPTKATTTTKAAKPATTKASKGKKSGKAKATTTGLTFQEQRVALRALKAEGKAPAGMTVREAIAAGLLGETAQPEPKAPAKAAKTGKGKQTKAEVAAKSEAYQKFTNLRELLKAHKAAGAIKAGVTVKEAIAQGLMNEDGTLPKAGKKAGKAKKAGKTKVTAEVTDAQPAVLRAADGPRNAAGHITNKREWGLRETLADSGKYDRHQIDAKVAEAIEAGLI